MKSCAKTDFRMYAPLVGPAEEICWTCGVAKEQHLNGKSPNDLSLSAMLKDPYADSTPGASALTGLNAWLPTPIARPFFSLPAPKTLLLDFKDTCTQFLAPGGVLHLGVPINSLRGPFNFCVTKDNAQIIFPPLTWITELLPGDNFYGVDRTISKETLAGYILHRANKTIEEGIRDAQALVMSWGGTGDICYLNEYDYMMLHAALGTQRNIISHCTSGLPDVNGIGLSCAYGHIMCFPTRGVPKDNVYVCTSDTWRWDINFGGYCTIPSQNALVVF